jgi:purine-binding chemotaxis protein CheW
MEELNQYLTFKLDNEIYGISIQKVREVLDWTRVTKVPQTPDYMIGVLNLRGNVVPIIDMKMKFGLNAVEKTINTCIIIVEVLLNNDISVIGILADSVKEVIEISDNQIEPAPKLGVKINIDFIKGIGKHDGDFIIILDIDKIFQEDCYAGVDNLEITDSATIQM